MPRLASARRPTEMMASSMQCFCLPSARTAKYSFSRGKPVIRFPAQILKGRIDACDAPSGGHDAAVRPTGGGLSAAVSAFGWVAMSTRSGRSASTNGARASTRRSCCRNRCGTLPLPQTAQWFSRPLRTRFGQAASVRVPSCQDQRRAFAHRGGLTPWSIGTTGVTRQYSRQSSSSARP